MAVFFGRIVTVILALQLSGVSALATDLKGEPYLLNCKQSMDFFGHAGKTIEDRFVDLARNKEQVLQLLIDYNAVFSKDFAEALLLAFKEVDLVKDDSLHSFKELSKFASASTYQLNQLVWRSLDIMVDLKSREEGPASEIKYLQAKNLVAALKASPQRPMIEDVLDSAVRFSIHDYIIKCLRGVKDFHHPSGSSIIAWSIVGTAAASGYFFAKLFSPGSTADMVFGGTMGSLLGAILGMGLGGATIATLWQAKKMAVERQIKISEGIRSQIRTFNRESKIALASAFDFLSKEETGNALSVKSANGIDVRSLSPVQIAYLGHLDVLELEGLNKIVKESMQEINVEQEIENVASIARALYESPSEFSFQMKLGHHLSAFLAKMQTILDARSKAVASLTEYADSISVAELNELSQSSYKTWSGSDEEIAKKQLLITKVKIDLKELEQIKVNNEALSQKIQRTQTVVDKLSQLLAQLPRGEEGWQKAAEEVILGLDELR